VERPQLKAHGARVQRISSKPLQRNIEASIVPR
jgi:hypothetical protein